MQSLPGPVQGLRPCRPRDRQAVVAGRQSQKSLLLAVLRQDKVGSAKFECPQDYFPVGSAIVFLVDSADRSRHLGEMPRVSKELGCVLEVPRSSGGVEAPPEGEGLGQGLGLARCQRLHSEEPALSAVPIAVLAQKAGKTSSFVLSCLEAGPRWTCPVRHRRKNFLAPTLLQEISLHSSMNTARAEVPWAYQNPRIATSRCSCVSQQHQRTSTLPQFLALGRDLF